MEKISRSPENVKKIIIDYLKRKSLRNEDDPWIVRESELGGLGIYSTRDIEVGDVIFKDTPIILGPRASTNSPEICVSCYNNQIDNLKMCEKRCGLKLCMNKCEESQNHQKECEILRQWRKKPMKNEEIDRLSKSLCNIITPIRSLFLSDADKRVVLSLKAHKSPQHGLEVDKMKSSDFQFNIDEGQEKFMRFVCSVLDSNAFQVIIGNGKNQSSIRGLYPLSSLANHDCTPNAFYNFDKNHVMTVKAAVFLPKNVEIFHSYTKVTWGTTMRRYHLLRTKHFLCKCLRCQDPTEFSTFMNGILCKFCKNLGVVVPVDPLKIKTKWICKNCLCEVSSEEVASITNLLGLTLNAFDNEDVAIMLKFLQQKLLILLPENNATVVELKLKLVWTLGHHEKFTWLALSGQLLEIKEKFCRDILNLLEKLRLGQCELRGLLLYELYCCLEEKTKRAEDKLKVCDKEMRKYIEEAANIMKNDVEAPSLIRAFWSSSDY